MKLLLDPKYRSVFQSLNEVPGETISKYYFGHTGLKKSGLKPGNNNHLIVNPYSRSELSFKYNLQIASEIYIIKIT